MPKRRVAVGEGGKAAGEQERRWELKPCRSSCRGDEPSGLVAALTRNGTGGEGRAEERGARKATSVWRETRGSEVEKGEAASPAVVGTRAPRSARYPHSLTGRDVRVNEAVREAGRSCLPRARECWLSMRCGEAGRAK